MHSIRTMRELGQSVWLDSIDHPLASPASLDRMIAGDGLGGMTSNPTIFEKAIAAGQEYDSLIRRSGPSEPDEGVLGRLQVAAVTAACDRFRAFYDATGGADGFVSIEVAPSLAHDTQGTIGAARALWNAVSRPNVMVKIPGTCAGLSAIEETLADGINVNVTLLFSVERYRQVAAAHRRALARLSRRGTPIDRVASVASFFVSRIDARVDGLVEQLPPDVRERAAPERGQAAIASAKLAYEAFEQGRASAEWRALAPQGAQPQRLLWASTTPKDPRYPDLYYVEALIGPDTIDTMAPETLRACLDHCQPLSRLPMGLEQAREHVAALAAVGIDLERVAGQLEDEGIRAFAASFDKAARSIGTKKRALHASA